MTGAQRVSGRRVLQGLVGFRFGSRVTTPKRRGVIRGRRGRLVVPVSKAHRQGHGRRAYIPVARTNRMVTEAERAARRGYLANRDEYNALRLKRIRKRLEQGPPA